MNKQQIPVESYKTFGLRGTQFFDSDKTK